MSQGSFIKEHSFEARKDEADRIMKKFPDRVPVIIEKTKESNVPDIDKKKYLVPNDLTIGNFLYVVRKRIKLPPEVALFLFIDKYLPPTSSLVSAVYDKHRNSDGFLYMVYATENTFGSLKNEL
jgi:GABA(A) receptor-associated protein